MGTSIAPVEAGINIVRGALDTDLAHDFQQEWIDYFTEAEEIKLSDFGLTGRKVPQRPYGLGFILGRYETFPVTNRIIDQLSIPLDDIEDMNIAVNYQPPKGRQVYHLDTPTKDGCVITFHGSDRGAYDYLPPAHPRPSLAWWLKETIEVNAGDVLYTRNPGLVHRGRNTSNEPRITAGIFNAR